MKIQFPIFAALIMFGATLRSEPAVASFEQDIQPLLKTYCYRCHGDGKKKAGLSLDSYKNEMDVVRDYKVWERVHENLAKREMPPKEKDVSQPTSAERTLLASWIRQRLDTHYRTSKPEAGRVTVRRLNRQEYNNTIRDLFGIDFKPAANFPEDDSGHGFDTIGDVLSLSPLHFEKYLAAAESILDRSIIAPIQGKPIDVSKITDFHRKTFAKAVTPQTRDAVAKETLGKFAARAFRRPLADAELDRYLRFMTIADKEGDGFVRGIKLAMQAMLVSPHFLFRWELDTPASGTSPQRPMNDFELASRLSYFLWSSMPDEALSNLAGKGLLRKNLESEVRRMIRDPKSEAFVANFAGQWLQIRNLNVVTPDKTLFPIFTDQLRDDMRRETELFFQYIMKEDRSVNEFLNANYIFANERLAKHYGINNVRGEQFQRINVTGTARGGLLAQASILTITSNPNRTSPVKRGKWILENILGTPIPAPPPNVPELDEKKVLSGNLREQMVQHRSNANCSSCHERMDPIGFGFENFDAVGRWRLNDGGTPINAADKLASGESFNGPAELKALLYKRKADFSRCLTDKMLTYALGRGMEHFDRATIESIVTSLEKQNGKFSALVIGVVKSMPFDMRRVDSLAP